MADVESDVLVRATTGCGEIERANTKRFVDISCRIGQPTRASTKQMLLKISTLCLTEVKCLQNLSFTVHKALCTGLPKPWQCVVPEAQGRSLCYA